MKKYAIVVERAERNYAAYVPDLPGCVATGKTVEETARLLREAIEIHVAGLREDGLPVPDPASAYRAAWPCRPSRATASSSTAGYRRRSAPTRWRRSTRCSASR